MNVAEELHYEQFKEFKKSGEIEIGSGRGYGSFISHQYFLKRQDEFIVNSKMTIRVQISLRTPKLREIYFLPLSKICYCVKIVGTSKAKATDFGV
jgi:hypothetical protein